MARKRLRTINDLLKAILLSILSVAALLIYQQVMRRLTAEELKHAGSYKVLEVVDGDTIEIDMDGRREKVRLIGTDTPEVGHHDTTPECFGSEASSFTKTTLQGQHVRLLADSRSSNRDRYNRLLRYVYRASDNLDLNYQLVRQGYSPEYAVFPFDRKEEFHLAAQIAQAENLGLWQNCTN